MQMHLKSNLRAPFFFISFLSISSLFMAGASSCLPGAGFSKTPGASDPPVDAVGGVATVVKCPSFPLYQTAVDPIFQRLCISCHGPGGKAAAKLQLTSGSSSSSLITSANYGVALAEVKKGQGVAAADPAAPDTTSYLLSRLNGTSTHDLTLDVAGDDYAQIRNWASLELAQGCTIDPATGAVTVANPPSP